MRNRAGHYLRGRLRNAELDREKVKRMDNKYLVQLTETGFEGLSLGFLVRMYRGLKNPSVEEGWFSDALRDEIERRKVEQDPKFHQREASKRSQKYLYHRENKARESISRILDAAGIGGAVGKLIDKEIDSLCCDLFSKLFEDGLFIPMFTTVISYEE